VIHRGDICKCDECGHEWLKRGSPARCPSHKCQSRKWNNGCRESGRSEAKTETATQEIVSSVAVTEQRGPSCGLCGGRGWYVDRNVAVVCRCKVYNV
jgi:hypothetical protein